MAALMKDDSIGSAFSFSAASCLHASGRCSAGAHRHVSMASPGGGVSDAGAVVACRACFSDGGVPVRVYAHME